MMFGRKERKTRYVMEPRADLEDLRDDSIALFIDSGLTQAQVHANGGPTPGTISKWLYKETRFPRLDTMRALIRAVGGEMIIVSDAVASRLRSQTQTSRLGLSTPTVPRLDARAHQKRKKAARHG
jgi:hypothetical protein